MEQEGTDGHGNSEVVNVLTDGMLSFTEKSSDGIEGANLVDGLFEIARALVGISVSIDELTEAVRKRAPLGPA